MAFAACCGCRETPATAKRFPARNPATLEGILAIDTSWFQCALFGAGLQLNRDGTDLLFVVRASVPVERHGAFIVTGLVGLKATRWRPFTMVLSNAPHRLSEIGAVP